MTCIGTEGEDGAVIVSTDTPTEVSSAFLTGNPLSSQAVMFGVMFTQVAANKTVESRYVPEDQFTVSAHVGADQIASATTTGSEPTAATGASTILTTTTGSSVTFTETAASGTVDFDYYDSSWACTRHSEPIDSSDLQISSTGLSVTVAVGVGDFVECTVSNTARLGEVSWNKVDADDPTVLLDGSEWTLTGPDGSLTVIDNGENDTDPTPGSLHVTGLTWGEYTLTETTPPTGYATDDEEHTFTINGDTLTHELGNIDNTRVPGEVSWNKVDADDSTVLLDGSEWTLTGPDGSLTVIDNGENDTDPTAGSLHVTGLTWGEYTLTETTPPTGYLLGENTTTLTIDSENTSIELSPFGNVAAEPGLRVTKSSDPVSGSQVVPGQTITYTVLVENIGNVDLTPAHLVDDLSDVLDDASYVAGSATATVDGQPSVSPEISGSTLTWSDDLPEGQAATVTYRVTVASDATAADRLVNVVTGTGDVPPGITPPTSNCAPGSSDPACTTTHTPVGPNPSPTPSPTPGEPTPTPSEPTPTPTPSESSPTPATPGSNDALPDTGGSAEGLALVGGAAALLLAAGAVVLIVSRRRGA